MGMTLLYKGRQYREASWTPPPFEQVWHDMLAGTGAFSPDDQRYLEDAIEDFGIDSVQQDYRALYREAVRLVTSDQLQGQDCWRTMELAEDLDPVTHEPLNIYWSYDPDYTGVEAFWGQGGEQVWWRARIDLDAVDRTETFWANLRPSTLAEREVTFRVGQSIWVYDVTLPDGTVVEINDWRTT